jgi:hypothetical protein
MRVEKADSNLRKLLRRARHPDAPGTSGGIPTVPEVSAMESELQSLASTISSWLALPSLPSATQPTALPLDAKARLLNIHFNLLTTLINLEIALKRDYGSAFRERFALDIPSQELSALPGLGTLAQGRLGEQYYGLVMDRGPDGRASKVRIRLSANLVHGLELGQLADNPNSETYILLVKYLTVRQLLQNLASLKNVKSSRVIAPVTLPVEFTSRLPSLGIHSELLAEQDRAAQEPVARSALAEALSPLQGQLPAFVDPQLAASFAKAIANTPTGIRTLQAPLLELLSSSLQSSLSDFAAREIESSILPFSALNTESQIPALREILSAALANGVLDRLSQAVRDGVLSIPMEKRHEVMEILEARQFAFAKTLPDSLLRTWAQNARKVSSTAIYDRKRNEFIGDLITDASTFQQSMERLRTEKQIDIRSLVRARSEAISALQPSQRALGWLNVIGRETSWSAARDSYAGIVAEQTTSEILVKGLVQPARLEKWIEDNAAKLVPPLPFSNAEIAKQLGQSIGDSKVKDLRNLRQIGELLGFHRILSCPEPRVSEVLNQSDAWTAYREALKDAIRDRHPILGVNIKSRDTGEPVPLAKALLEANPEQVTTEESWENSSSLVDEAIAASEARIRSTILKAARAKTLAELEPITSASIATELVISAFPAQSRERELAFEQMAAHGLGDQFMHGKVGGYLSYGFGAMMLLHATGWLIRPLRPFTQAINWGLEPLIKGYMASALPLVMLDTAYQYRDLRKKEMTLGFARDLFTSAPMGGSLVDAATVEALRKDYAWSKWFFWGRVGMDTVCMYIPESLHLVNKLGQKMILREFMGDMDAFRILGLEVGNWGGVTRAQVLARTRPVILVPEAVSEIEVAFTRLQSRIQSGRTWDPNVVFHGEVKFEPMKTRDPQGHEIEELVPVRMGEPSNPIERKIWRALQADQKAAGK